MFARLIGRLRPTSPVRSGGAVPATPLNLGVLEQVRPGEEAVFEASGLNVQFETKAGTARVLNDMSFTCRRCQMIGLVGESGSGKSVLAGVLVNRIRRPGLITGGQVLYEGRDLLRMNEEQLRTIRGGKIGMIVSNAQAALNPVICVGDQIANIYQSHLEVPKKVARERALQAIRATGINDPERRYVAYPHELSGGMAKRIIIAAALVCEPVFLIADEPTSGLDVTIQAQVLDNMIEAIGKQRTAGTVLMTRDLGIIAQYCNRVVVTYAGQVVEEASADRFFAGPTHPYSCLLLASASLDSERRYERARMGPPPNKFNLPEGCLFRERCLVSTNICALERPCLAEIEPDHLIRCWRAKELL